MSGVRKEETYRSDDPVYGATGHHTTATGAKMEEVAHGVKSYIPGTKEHAATTPSAGTTGTGMGHETGYTGTGMSHEAGYTGTGAGTGTATGVRHTAENPVTGETHTHSTEMGAKLDQGWQNLKQSVPGTTEHKATHPTGATGTTTTRPM